MHARVNATEWNPEKVEEGIRITEEKIIPGYRALPGFQGYFLLTEPGGEKAMAITIWDTKDQMDASAAVARAMIGELKDLLRAPPQATEWTVMFNVQP
jgi:quinol monooxygenase YgiN